MQSRALCLLFELLCTRIGSCCTRALSYCILVLSRVVLMLSRVISCFTRVVLCCVVLYSCYGVFSRALLVLSRVVTRAVFQTRFSLRHLSKKNVSLSFVVKYKKRHHLEPVIRRCSAKNLFLKNFAIFTGQHLRWNFCLIEQAEACNACKLIKMRLQYRCFPANFAKFLRTSFSIKHLWQLLLITLFV